MMPHDARTLGVGSRFNTRGRIWRVRYVSMHARTSWKAYIEADTVPPPPKSRARGRERSFRLSELLGFNSWRLP